MTQFRKKPVVIEAITFEELVKHGLENGANVENGMPWSWNYNGHPISHENDECYLIPTLEGTMKMTPNDMLITGVQGEIYPCKKDIFEATYELEADVEKTKGLTLEQHTQLRQGEGSFGLALEALKEGKLVCRSGWNGKGMFIVKQIPGVIGTEIIPKMQSLPQSVKDVLIERNQPISYESQMLIINSNGRADSWVPSSSDCFANDWQTFELSQKEI